MNLGKNFVIKSRCRIVEIYIYVKFGCHYETSTKLYIYEKMTYWYITIFFLIRIRKFCLMLAVLNFLTEPCNATKKNARLGAIKAYYLISFIFFLLSTAHRQPLGGVLQKSCSATVLKPIKKYLQRNSVVH